MGGDRDPLAEQPAEQPVAVQVRAQDLAVGMVLAKNAMTKTGMVVAGAGMELTPILVERLGQFARGVGLEEPLDVFVRQKAQA